VSHSIRYAGESKSSYWPLRVAQKNSPKKVAATSTLHPIKKKRISIPGFAAAYEAQHLRCKPTPPAAPPK
jgi:hypothetical protein